ncbi:MAG: DNA translocase FtsK 4TM domain-containing protein, partial [Betaproteobacteria bacterium]
MQISSAAKSAVQKTPRKPLPPKVAALLRESWWLLLIGAALYLVLILATYSKSDPGWSHQASGSQVVVNAGGKAGAWMADVGLYVFGLSAWWWVLFLIGALVWGYRRIEVSIASDGRSILVACTGFFVLIASSSAFESLRLYSLKAQLPHLPGGVVGELISGLMIRGFGFTGSTLILMILWGVGLSLLTGLSWVVIIEKLGGAIEIAYVSIRERWQKRQDRKLGEQAAVERQENVEEDRKRFEDHGPIRIEPPKTVIPKSDRVIKERQKPLFEDLPDSPLPPLHLLDEPPADVETVSEETLEYTSRLIEKKLSDFGIEVKVVAAQPGPVITRYEIEPAIGVKGSQVLNLVKDLARALSVVSVRVVETIPGRSCMGLEIPNPKRQVVRLSEILSSKVYAEMPSPLTLAMGKDIAGNPIVADLAKMPHVLVAGTTGSGKSVAINAMILSLLYKATAKDVRLILVDPKMLELSVYEGVPHLLTPVVTDMKQAAHALNWCLGEMDRRYKLMSTLGVRNLSGFNQKIKEAEKAG